MILVEGPDCSGKTTLAARIEAEYPYLNFRRAPSLSSTVGASASVYDWWRAELARPKWERMHGVYDRCFAISEAVYTPIVDRVPNCSPWDLVDMIASVMNERPTIIFCLPDWDNIKRTMRSHIFRGRPQLEGLTESKHYMTYLAYVNQMALWSGILNTKNKQLVWQYDWANRDDTDSVIREYVEDHSV